MKGAAKVFCAAPMKSIRSRLLLSPIQTSMAARSVDDPHCETPLCDAPQILSNFNSDYNYV